MFKYFVIVLISLALQGVSAGDSESPASDEKIVMELPCLAAGGICVRRADCPPGKMAAARGLCPLSQDRGYNCCHSVPLSESRCGALGGACMPRCSLAVRLPRATDCGAELCCRLE